MERIVASVEAVMDRATVVTPSNKVKLCIGCKYFDKGARQWHMFHLGKSQDSKLSHERLRPWEDKGLVKVVIWKFARWKQVVDSGKTTDYDVGGGFDNRLPTMLDS